MELKAVLESGSRFGHEARGVDTAVPQGAAIGEVSLEFLPVSPGEESRCRQKERDCNVTAGIKKAIQNETCFVDNTDCN